MEAAENVSAAASTDSNNLELGVSELELFGEFGSSTVEAAEKFSAAASTVNNQLLCADGRHGDEVEAALQIDGLFGSGTVGAADEISAAAPTEYDTELPWHWSLWQSPKFGCSDASQILCEISECCLENYNTFVHLAAFDAEKKEQVISFLVQQPCSVLSSRSWT